MSERDMLPRRPYALLAPEPRGFDEAMTRARRRRRRTAGTGVLASVSAVLLGASLMASTPDTEARLEITGPADLREAVEGADPTAAAAAALDLDEPAGVPGDVTEGTGSTSADATVVTDDPTATSRAPSAPPRPKTTPRTRRLDPPTERTTVDVANCSPFYASQPWCLYASRTPDADFDKTGNSTLSISVCLARVVTDTRTLNFAGEQQVDFAITKKGSDEVLWQWAYQAAFDTEATSDDVRPGECRLYSVPWLEQVDNNGDHINEAGTYVLTASNLARELTTNTSTHTFELNR